MIEETQKFAPAELQKKKEGFLFLFYIYKWNIKRKVAFI